MSKIMSSYREFNKLRLEFGLVTTVIGISGVVAEMYSQWCLKVIRNRE